jgi:hypothetical protein
MKNRKEWNRTEKSGTGKNETEQNGKNGTEQKRKE